jgi:hypothetical protein
MAPQHAGQKYHAIKRQISTPCRLRVLQFRLPAAYTIDIPAGEAQGFTQSVLLGCADIFSHKQDFGFEVNPRARCPNLEGGGGSG